MKQADAAWDCSRDPGDNCAKTNIAQDAVTNLHSPSYIVLSKY